MRQTFTDNGISIILPVHNEQKIIKKTIGDLLIGVSRLKRPNWEIVVCENGSKDATPEILRKIKRKNRRVRVISLKKPSYGLAIREGIKRAKGEYLFLFNADFYSLSFLNQALNLLENQGVDLVIASKRHPDSVDSRSSMRRLLTSGLNFFLRILFGLKQSDTHGLKAFKKSYFMDLVEKCVTHEHLFDTELIIRFERLPKGKKMIELPIEVEEKRETRKSVLKKLISEIRDLIIIFFDIHSLRRK